jgi:DNA-binding CsgD family transcriptional regulator
VTTPPFSAQDLALVALIAEGLDNAAIGVKLGLTRDQVSRHSGYLLTRHHVHHRAGLVALACRAGQLQPGSVVDGPLPWRQAAVLPGVAAGLTDQQIAARCTTCGQPCGWIDCPTGGWWAHASHPADGHDAAADETDLRDEIARLRTELDQARAAWRGVREALIAGQSPSAVMDLMDRHERAHMPAPACACRAEVTHQVGCGA